CFPKPKKVPEPMQVVPSSAKKAPEPTQVVAPSPKKAPEPKVVPPSPKKAPEPKVVPPSPKKAPEKPQQAPPTKDPQMLSKQPDKSKGSADKPARADKATQQNDDEYVEPAERCPPPEQVSKKTLMKRLDRICTPRADGTFKVPMEIINSYKNTSCSHWSNSFASQGLFTKKVNRKYEEINEKSVETEFEFLTEEEMELKGWSEKKIKGAKKICEKRPGYKRKSEYCDEWMYWVAVKVRGSNKKTKRNTVAEILEGEGDEQPVDADEAMEDFPFALEGDGDKAPKEPGDGDSESDDSSDDGEEAARVLKKIGFPELTKKPQDSCTLVSSCLQKRVMKIEPVVRKLDEITQFKQASEKDYKPNTAHLKYRDTLLGMIAKLNDLDDRDQKSLRENFQEAKRVRLGSQKTNRSAVAGLWVELTTLRAVEAELLFDRAKSYKLPAVPKMEKPEAPKVKAKPKTAAAKQSGSSSEDEPGHDSRAQLYAEMLGDGAASSVQLEAFWKMYKYHHPEHVVFSAEHIKPAVAIPVCIFSDEGKGPKRGNFLMTCLETPIGLSEMPGCLNCCCSAHVSQTPSQFVPDCDTVADMCDAAKEAAKQTTNLQGSSFLTRHYLFGVPDWVYKHHSSVLQTMMQLMADDLCNLFTTGITIDGCTYFAVLVGMKGDLKHMAEKYGSLTRSYANLGKVNDLAMCSHCLAGTPGLAWDQASHEPCWANSEFAGRPWQVQPVFCSIPFDPGKPEAALKLDVFHLFKVGLGRDLVASIVLFARLGYYDWEPEDSRELKQRLARAWKHFSLWRQTAKETVACKYFSPALFNIKNLSDFGWANVKGSDTMLFLRYILWYAGFLLASRTLPDAHRRLFALLNKTIVHAQQAMHIMYTHGLWLDRKCAQSLYLHFMCLLSGYQTLAARCLSMNLTFFCLKPKFHGIHHLAYDLKKALRTPTPLVLNPLCWGNEMNEDAINKICSMTLKVSIRTLTRRVLQRHFLKKSAVIRRHRQDRRTKGLRV
ncbi:unnamed protein product, partial [Symbiodinium sp. KB8]